MTPAERLLAAADLLDKRAGEAASDWRSDSDNHIGLLAITTPYAIGANWRKSGERYSFTGPDDATTAYIATMHPEVGKKQAAMLRAFSAAVGMEWRIFHEMWKPEQRVRMLNDRMPGLVEALDLADLILASAP